jgi:hypothetical protein
MNYLARACFYSLLITIVITCDAKQISRQFAMADIHVVGGEWLVFAITAPRFNK